MRRYLGEKIAPGARVAVVSGDALGNYVVLTPLLRKLQTDLRPAELHYFGGVRTQELWAENEDITEGMAILGGHPRQALREALARPAYDLVINIESAPFTKAFTALLTDKHTAVVGPCVDSEGRHDLPQASTIQGLLAGASDWTAPDLTDRFPILDSGFMGEILCRVAYLEGAIPGYRLASHAPEIPIPDVLVSLAASLPDKLWRLDLWLRLVELLRGRGVTVGLLGAKPALQHAFWMGTSDEDDLLAQSSVVDLRGRLTLPQMVGAISQAKLVVTIDNGILHLAAATETPVIGLFRNGIHRLWAPPVDNLNALVAPSGHSVQSIPWLDVELGVRNVL